MKSIKKIFALLLACVMVMGLSVTAFAQDVDCKGSDSGTITVENATIGQTYTIYKIFDATYNGENVSYTYTKTGDNDSLYAALTADDSVFTLTASAGDSSVYVVTVKEGKENADIISFIEGIAKQLTSVGTVEATENTIVFKNLDYGYYYITSSLGAVVTIDSAVPTATVIDKNTQSPTTPDKEIVDGDSKDATTADVGDTVNYSVTFTAVNYVTAEGATTSTLVENYVVKDTPTNLNLQTTGLTVTVLEKGATEAKTLTLTTDYTVSKDETSGVVTVTIPWAKNTDSVEKLDTSIYAVPATVTITYSAIVTGAVATTDTANNSVDLYYNNNTQVGTDTTDVTLFEFTVNKVDSNKTKINLVAVKEGDTISYYRPATTAEASVADFESAVIEAGKVAIKGLDDGTYYLRETKAPEGYNLLTEDVKIVVAVNSDGNETVTVGTGDATTETTVNVVNQSGSELPSAGGIGTTIFYVVGTILVLGAAILLITKKRMSKME